MSTRATKFVPGEFYHVYNRGTDKRMIFQNQSDYERFQVLLYLLNTQTPVNVRDAQKGVANIYASKRSEPLVAIGAYCLMPNHFHILLTPLDESGLSVFMQKLSTAYSMYFNRKYERTGGLFAGKFKAEHVNEDRYLKYLFAYIHLNPIKLFQPDWKEAGIENLNQATTYLRGYTYSSYPDQVGKPREQSAILELEPFPKYHSTVKAAQQEIHQWLSIQS